MSFSRSWDAEGKKLKMKTTHSTLRDCRVNFSLPSFLKTTVYYDFLELSKSPKISANYWLYTALLRYVFAWREHCYSPTNNGQIDSHHFHWRSVADLNSTSLDAFHVIFSTMNTLKLTYRTSSNNYFLLFRHSTPFCFACIKLREAIMASKSYEIVSMAKQSIPERLIT